MDAKKEANRLARLFQDFQRWLEDQGIDSFDLDAVYLHGSRAREEATENSDWDFLLVGRDFDELEEARCTLAEEGEFPTRFRVFDPGEGVMPNGIDVLFASAPTKDAVLLWSLT